MKQKYTKNKKNDCIKCGEPCMRSLCRKCFEKRRYKGAISRLRSLKNRE